MEAIRQITEMYLDGAITADEAMAKIALLVVVANPTEVR